MPKSNDPSSLEKTCLHNMPKTTKRKDLSALEKSKVLQKYDTLPPCSQRVAAINLGLTQSTLNRLLRDRKRVETASVASENPNRKRQRNGKDVVVETALLWWFTNRTQDGPVTRGILMEKASHFAASLGHDNFKPTDGWLRRWKERNNIASKKLRGETKDVDNSSAENWLKGCLPELVKNFKPDDIFTTDEMGLYFRAIPDYSLVFKQESDAAERRQKERITILITCNMSGTIKRNLLVIGKSKNPRCFRGASLPVTYKYNSNTWMTGEIFCQFLVEWDEELRKKKKKIALILNNCTAHPNVVLKCIKLWFLPAYTTSIIEPLDQGIIKTLKTLYRQDMRNFIIRIIDEDNQKQAKDVANSITLLTAIHMLQKAWNNLKSSTIVNCFKKAGFFPHIVNNDNDSLNIDDDLDDELKSWINIDDYLQVFQSDPEENGEAGSLENEQMEENVETEENDDNCESDPPPSSKEIRAALLVLRRNLELRGASPDEFNSFYKVEEDAVSKIPTKYTTIYSIFNKDNEPILSD